MPINGVALGALGIGSIFLYSAIKGKSILASSQAIITGKNPGTVAATNQIAPVIGGTGASAGSNLSGFSGGGTPGANQTLANQMATAMGWGNQTGALDQLWTRESGFRTNATNPSSGAYGIPQSLPASKMASAGSDWKTNPATQIKWGLDYIKSTYGDPNGAWAHEQSHGWY